jgi:tyrosyl-tRNA synthetase
VNNYDWMKNFTFLSFARDIGKCITVNYMMAKDSVKRRLNGEFQEGMSFTEFTYQLLQGYDFLHLYETKNCRIQGDGYLMQTADGKNILINGKDGKIVILNNKEILYKGSSEQ